MEYGRFSSKFEYSRLSQLCIEKNGVQTGPFGSQLHKEDYVTKGTPIITVEHLGDNRIIHIDTPFVTDEDKKRLQKYQMKEGDIIFSRVGSVDRRALVRKDEDGWLFSGRCLCVRVDKTKIDPTYLSYFFGLESFKNYIRGIAVGATMPSINTKILSEVPVYYPESLNQQKQTAKILSDLDDKIHINNQINQTLESIAQALFKSWFIDFDPVRAKIVAKLEGADPEIAAMCAISGKSQEELKQMSKDDFAELQASAALFPDELVETELGEVPKGWDKYSLSKMITLIGGGTPKRSEPNYWNGDIFWFSVKDVPNEGEVFVITTQEKISELGLNKSSTKLLPVGTTIITARGTVGKIALVGYEMAMNQSCYGVQGINGVRQFMTYYLIKNAVEVLKKNTHGAVFDTITQSTFDTVTSIKPSIEMMDLFESKVEKIMGHIKNNLYENNSLIALRDTLLPKLLSGELDVSCVQDEVA